MNIKQKSLFVQLEDARQLWDGELARWTRAEGALRKAEMEVERYKLRCSRAKAASHERAQKWVTITNQIAAMGEKVESA